MESHGETEREGEDGGRRRLIEERGRGLKRDRDRKR
jgi:hypothetical protein